MFERILVLMATAGRFWGTCIQWQKMGRTKFRCPWYFINHLVILYHQPTGGFRKIFPVKCNDGGVITLKPTLTVPCSVLLLKHNKGVEYV